MVQAKNTKNATGHNRKMDNSISGKNIKRLLVAHTIFTAGRVFFEIFLNVFIWKKTGSFEMIAWFNILYLLFHVTTFHVFAGLVKKGKVHVIRILSLLGFSLSYLAIYFAKDLAIDYVLIFASFIGIFNGMYWIAYQVLRFDLTSKENRGNYAGFESGSGVLVDIVMPSLGGAIIVANFFGGDYSNLFLFGTFFFLASLIIGNVKFKIFEAPDFHFKKTFLTIWKNKNIMKSMWAYTLGSFSRGGALLRLILPLLIFDATKNELKLGGWLSFFAVVAIISSLAFGKFISYKNYNLSLFLGGIAYFLLVISVLVFPFFIVYILFGALVKIVSVAIDVPRRVISENLVHSLEDDKANRVEYIVMREWFSIGLGRIMGFVMLFMVTGLEGYHMKILILAVAVVALAEMFFIRSVKSDTWSPN